MISIRLWSRLMPIALVLISCSGGPKPSLNSRDPDLRRRQINYLADSSDATEHFQVFVDVLHNDADYLVRCQSAVALGNLKPPEAVPNLIKALEDISQWVRSDVATALGKIGDYQSVQPLLQILPGESSVGTRRAIIGALGKIGSPDAIPSLIQRLEDIDESVAEITYQALRQITHQDLAKDIDVWQKWFREREER